MYVCIHTIYTCIHIAVLVQAEHLCVKSRGIGDHASGMTTSKLGGHFFNKHTVRSEFMSLAT